MGIPLVYIAEVAHGLPMDKPWVPHRSTMGLQCWPMGWPSVTHGSRVGPNGSRWYIVDPWTAHGSLMGFQWWRMGRQWVAHGSPVGLLWMYSGGPLVAHGPMGHSWVFPTGVCCWDGASEKRHIMCIAHTRRCIYFLCHKSDTVDTSIRFPVENHTVRLPSEVESSWRDQGMTFVEEAFGVFNVQYCPRVYHCVGSSRFNGVTCSI